MAKKLSNTIKGDFIDFLRTEIDIDREDYPNKLDNLFDACKKHGNSNIKALINDINNIYQITEPSIILRLIKLLHQLKNGKVSPGKEYKGPKNNAPGRPAIKYYLIFLLKIKKPANLVEIMDLAGKTGDKFVNEADELIAKFGAQSTDREIADTSISEETTRNTSNNLTLPFSKLPRQIIFYGAPGNGKSHGVKEFLRNMKTDIDEIRVTFHPEMDYASFVGAYMPTKENKTLEITYEFQPQPFLNAYQEAKSFPDKKVFLIIEEINRGNCAQIFGDIFQLLDRDQNGESRYSITPNTNIKKWLKDNHLETELKLPNNLYIWATMNTSDQSLYPIDSAFTRRWEMHYVPVGIGDNWKIEGIDMKWGEIQETINIILDSEHLPDKKLGSHFIMPKPNSNPPIIECKDFVGKVIFYLYKYIFSVYSICEDLMIAHPFDSFYKPDFSGNDIFSNYVIDEDKVNNLIKGLKSKADEIKKTMNNDSNISNQAESALEDLSVENIVLADPNGLQ